ALTAHAMLGDREKCIQAQMDVSITVNLQSKTRANFIQEYLSKPLKQNTLIQVILKVYYARKNANASSNFTSQCATLGGPLLERGSSLLSARPDETERAIRACSSPSSALIPRP